MKIPTRKLLAVSGLAIAAIALMAQYGGGVDAWWEVGSGRAMPMFAQFPDPTGELVLVNMEAPVATRDNAFFESMGVNGRACVTCHQPSSGMGLSAERIRQQYKDSYGKDPVFAAIDGSDCPTLPQQEKSSHSLLLDKGLFRIYLPLPAHADFKVEVVHDPTGCNTDPAYGLASAHPTISVFRRPRVVGNLRYVTRDSTFTLDPRVGASIAADGRNRSLAQQAADAVHAHEQAGRDLTHAELQQILDFESQVFVAQGSDNVGGDLTEPGGPLGAWALGFNKQLPRPDAPVFLQAAYWKSSTHSYQGAAAQNQFRESVARGNAIFTSRTFGISGVANLPPDSAGRGTCSTCHSAPGSGSNLAQQPMDIGTTIVAGPAFAPAGLPLFKVTCSAGTSPHPFAGRVIYTTDPGRALTTGKCADAGSIVAQQLRALSARAPYFANGSAATLRDVVNYYDLRFNIHYTEAEKQDLINFLSVL